MVVDRNVNFDSWLNLLVTPAALTRAWSEPRAGLAWTFPGSSLAALTDSYIVAITWLAC